MAYEIVLLSVAMIVFAAQQLMILSEDKLLVPSVTSASNLFSQNLYKQVAEPGQSIVYSPYSIHSALTMTSIGAKGKTLQEMRKVLGLTEMSDADVGMAYQNLITELSSATKVNLSTSNAIFANPAYTIKDKFINEISDKYHAMAANFNLSAPNGPEADINDYISKNTNHLIKDLLAPGSITTDTLMLLINTIYFHGQWEDKFEKYETMKQDFYQDLSSTKKVDMMHRTGDVMYKKDLDRKVEVVELPFKGSRFGLYIVLPNEVEGITDLENTLTSGVDDLFQNMARKELEIAIPKFKIETTLKLERKLQAMGMSIAFKCPQADFSGMSEGGPFCITSIVHKAVIDVMEDGTTAAAATVITVGIESVRISKESFKADHPFMYFLRDKQSGQILFQGKFSG